MVSRGSQLRVRTGSHGIEVAKKSPSRSGSRSRSRSRSPRLHRNRSRSRSPRRRDQRSRRSPSYSQSRSRSRSRSPPRTHNRRSFSRSPARSPRRRSRTPEDEEVSEAFIRTVAAEVKGHGEEYAESLQEREESNARYAFLKPGVSLSSHVSKYPCCSPCR